MGTNNPTLWPGLEIILFKGVKKMVMVNIDNDTLVDMLIDRLKVWTQDNETISLYRKMYDNYCDSGVFDGSELDVNNIVDNDYVNYCNTVEKSEKDFKKLLKLYKKGDCDVSCESFKDYTMSYIEAIDDDENPTCFLIRY